MPPTGRTDGACPLTGESYSLATNGGLRGSRSSANQPPRGFSHFDRLPLFLQIAIIADISWLLRSLPLANQPPRGFSHLDSLPYFLQIVIIADISWLLRSLPFVATSQAPKQSSSFGAARWWSFKDHIQPAKNYPN
ncbi:MAG: hypothetical protein ACK4LB_00060 [Spirosomataceae bacterium]